MSTPLPLRRRVALALTALGFLLSALFAATTIWMTEDYEYVLASEILRGQAEDYGLRLSNGLPAQLPKTHRLSGYARADVPPHYARLAPGVHEDATADGMHIGVFDTSAGRLWFVVDLTDLRAQASDDELGRLAGAIDDYQRRLVEAEAHEQAFFADASHELRTPIAVVQGATEVMLDAADTERDPRRIERLRRLERGVREMTDLVEMLLAVARRRALQFETVDAAGFLREALEPLQTDATPVAADIVASGALRMPRREALLLLRHAVGKLGWPASGDALSLRLDDSRLDIAVHARNDMPSTAQRSDTGGLGALAQRLAERIGWRCEQASPGRIVFALPADASDGARTG